MPLINYKVKLEIKWKKHCVLAAAENDHNNANPDNILFTFKIAKLYVSVIFLSAKDTQKLPKRFSKRFRRLVYWTKYKTKRGINEYNK